MELLHSELRPWSKALGKLVAEVEDRTLWLHIGASSATVAIATFTLEGIELLAWLAQLSLVQFRDIVQDVWPALRHEFTGSGLRHVCVGIRLHVGNHGGSVIRACFASSPVVKALRLPTGTSEPTHSDSYVKAYRVFQLASTSPARANEGLSVAPAIPLHIYFDGYRYRGFGPAYDVIQHEARTQTATQALTTDSNVPWLRLRVVKIETGGVRQGFTDVDHLELLHELVAVGVKVGSCAQPSFSRITRASAREKFVALQKLLRTHPDATHGAAAVPFPIDELWIEFDDVEECLFSAIATMRSVRKVVFCAPPVRAHQKALQAVALGLFSAASDHRVEQISIRTEKREAFEALQAALVSRADPLALICDDHAASIHTLQHLRATASRFTLFDPTNTDESDLVVVDTYVHEQLRIISHDAEWWSVMLPAWGRAWVHASEIVVTTASALSVSNNGRHVVKKIELNCSDVSLDEYELLLQRMNPAVEDVRLRVPVIRTPRPGGTWPRIAKSLPCLRSLSLEGVESSALVPLLDALASPDVAPLLLRLALEVILDANPFPVQFLEALVDRRHRVYRCLEVLSVDASSHAGSADCTRLIATQLDGVLVANKHLFSLTLRLPGIPWVSKSTVASVKRRLVVHNGGSLPTLELRCKLAFLSVLVGGNTVDAMQQLDSEVVSMVFQYAGRCCRRQVTVVAKPPKLSLRW